MLTSRRSWLALGFGVATAVAATASQADTISPLTFSSDIGVGESVTIEKTVVVEAAGPSDALIDVHFLFDTSGSMGAEIAAAQAAAADIFAALDAFGDVAAGVGVYSEAARLPGTPPDSVINQDITTDIGVATAALGDVMRDVPDFGFDRAENGNTAIDLASSNLSWRTGSNRFIIAFGDQDFKSSDAADSASHFIDDFDDNDGAPISSNADTIASMAAAGVELVGLDFGSGNMTGSVDALGGTSFFSSTAIADIVADITSGISGGFDTYSTVTVGDLGGGLPEIAVSAVCTGADIGVCAGSDATGAYDRTVDRTFTFDVTFERVADGDTVFETFALVDDGIVAREVDTFTTAAVPLPAGVWLLLGGLGGLVMMRRKHAA